MAARPSLLLLCWIGLCGDAGAFLSPVPLARRPHTPCTHFARGGATNYQALTRTVVRPVGVPARISKKGNLRIVRASSVCGMSDSAALRIEEEVTAKGFFGRLRRMMYRYFFPMGMRKLLDQYFVGLKGLFRDAGRAWRLWRGTMDAVEASSMSEWQQRTLLRRAPADVLRMLPIAFNPIPPPFGLMVPALACMFPRTLLTHQFWSEEQAAEFASMSFAEKFGRRSRMLHQAALRQIAHADWDAHKDFIAGDDGDAEEEEEDGDGVEMPEDGAKRVASLFVDGGDLSLERLSRQHLLMLYNAWVDSVPLHRRMVLAAPGPLAPLGAIRAELRRLGDEIVEDDALLRAGEGDVGSLSMEELCYACERRNIRPPDGDVVGEERKEMLVDALRMWLAVPRMSPSLALHLPVLLDSRL